MKKVKLPMLSTRAWIALLTVLVLVCLGSWYLLTRPSAAAYADIIQNGQLIRRVSLSQPTRFTIEWEDGYNIIEVSDGKIRIIESDCRDQICVKHGALTGHTPIVCLPHKLVIQAGSEPSDADFEDTLDAITG